MIKFDIFVVAVDSISLTIYTKWDEIFHEERRAELAGGGGDMRESRREVREQSGQSLHPSPNAAVQGGFHGGLFTAS